jgi:hypothetical protein
MAGSPQGMSAGERLKRFWAFGEGAAKIRWNTDGDFDRCVKHLRGKIADPEGYCNVVHQMATGHPPGQHGA